ncbi:MAG: retropepsin-like aspartic protease [Pseudomonadales bacterium]
MNSSRHTDSKDRQEQPGRGSGLLMIAIAWLLILLVVGIWFQQWLEQRRNPNNNVNSSFSEHQKPQVILRANRQHQYRATGLINDEKVVFLIDTGATEVVVPANLEKKLGLRRGVSTQAMTANNLVTVYRTSIDHLKIGTLHLTNVAAVINPSMPDQTILLGMSALHQTELRHDNNQLTIIQR